MDLYLNDHMSDIVFFVGSGITNAERPVRFVAHKCVMTFASPVFAIMLLDDRFTEGKRGEISITDVTPTAFNALLYFAYTTKLNHYPTSEYPNILYAAEKYAMNNLKVQCFQHLEEDLKINIDNFLPFWSITENYFCEYMPPSIVGDAKRFLSQNAPQILENIVFDKLSRPLLSSIIESNFLHRVKEIDVFNFVLRWARMECCRQGLSIKPRNLRLVLGDLIYKIRYLLMTIFELTNGPIKSRILTTQEGQLLLQEKELEEGLLPPPWNNNLVWRARELESETSWDLDEVKFDESQHYKSRSVVLAFSSNVVLSRIEFSVFPDDCEVEVEYTISDLRGEVFKGCTVQRSYFNDEEKMMHIDIPVCLQAFTGYQLKVVCVTGLFGDKHYVSNFCHCNGQVIMYIGGYPNEIVDELLSVKYWKNAFEDKNDCVYKVWKTDEVGFVNTVTIQCI